MIRVLLLSAVVGAMIRLDPGCTTWVFANGVYTALTTPPGPIPFLVDVPANFNNYTLFFPNTNMEFCESSPQGNLPAGPLMGSFFGGVAPIAIDCVPSVNGTVVGLPVLSLFSAAYNFPRPSHSTPAVVVGSLMSLGICTLVMMMLVDHRTPTHTTHTI